MAAANDIKIQYNFNQSLLGFVPAMIIKKTVSTHSEIKLPDRYTIRTVVMFADISGFTKLSEYLQKEGKEGAELLAFAINRYMELLVKAIGKSGGDIFKYAGDALIVLWPPTRNNTEEELTLLLRQVLQNALDIQTKLDNLAVIENQKLSVKIGFGVGDVSIIHVGGERGRAEYLAVGEPLSQAFESEHHAESGGVIIVSQAVHQRIHEFFNSKCLTPQHHEKTTENHETTTEHHESKFGPFYLITSSKQQSQQVQMKADALMIRTKIKNDQIERNQKTLRSYVPAAVIPFMKIDEEKWSAELRTATILFISLGLDLQQVMQENGLERLQQVITLVQICVYKYQGSLNKFLMDDKGSTLIVVFGLPPMSHQDDPTRGVFTALEMVRELNKIDCSCSVGITTGVVFTGVVGTSGSRREYSVLGDCVNLSARFMQAAILDPINKIFLDEETKTQSEHKISFHLQYQKPVKGKQGLQNFYTPINNQDYLTFNSLINFRSHLHNTAYQKGEGQLFGREKQVKFIYESIKKFLVKKNGKTRGFFLTGEYGIGKTVLAQAVMQQVIQYIQKEGISQYKYNERAKVLVSNMNPEQEVLPYNGIRRIMQHIFEEYMRRHNYENKEELIEEIYKQIDEEEFTRNSVLEQLYQILGITNTIINQQYDFEKDKQCRSLINKFLIQLMNLYLEYNEDDEDNNSSNTTNNSNNLVSPLILCFDDMQQYDKESWKMIKKLLKKCRRRLYILGMLRDEFYYVNPFLSGPIPFDQYMQKIEDEEKDTLLYTKMKLKGLELDDIEILVKHYKQCFSVNFDLLILLIHKTKGNPFDVITFLWSLDNGKFLEISNPFGQLKPKENLRRLMELNEFIIIEVPISRQKINNPILDKLLLMLPEKRKDDNHKCEKYLLLKIASVIGLSFTTDALSKVHPFKDLITLDKLFKHLQDLVKEEIVEVINEGDYCHNITYRFTLPFFREIIYQRMTYQHRRKLHRYLVDYLEKTPLSISDKYDQERLTFHWQMTEEKNENNEQHLLQARRSIMLRQASNILSQATSYSQNTILKKGYLYKKEYIGTQWEKRFFILTVKELKYYENDKQFLEEQDAPLASIPLHRIYQTMLLKSQPNPIHPYGFSLNTASYISRNEEKGLREFFFAAQTAEDVEDWKTFIDLGRTNAIYNDFVSTYGRIKFPLLDYSTSDKTQQNKKINQFYVAANQQRKDDEYGSALTKKSVKKSMMSIRGKHSTFGDFGSFSRQTTNLNDSAALISQALNEITRKRMEHFLNVGMNLFCSHSIEASKNNIKSDKFLGKAPEFAFKNPKYYAVPDSLYKIDTNTDMRMSTFQIEQKNSKPLEDDSPYGLRKRTQVQFKEFNKVSTNNSNNNDNNNNNNNNENEPKNKYQLNN